MSRFFSESLRFVFGAIFVLSITGCEAFWQLTLGDQKKVEPPEVLEVEKIPTPLKPAPTPPPNVTETKPVSGNKICQDRLKERDVRSYKENDPQNAAVEIDAKREFTDSSLVSWAIETAKKVFELDACSLQAIRFTASGKDGLLYEGVIHQPDYKLMIEGRISQAEFSRRFEIHQMATLSFVKNSLRRARASGDVKQAQKWSDKWLEQEPGNVIAQIVRANIALESASAFDAIALYEEVLRSTPENPFARFNLAFAKKQVGSFADAIKIFESLAAMPVTGFPVASDEILLNLADAYASNNQLKEAQATLERVKDKNALAYVLVSAHILRADKKFTEAKAVLDADKAHHNNEVLLFNRVLLDLDLKDDIGARDWLDKLKTVNVEMARELDFLEPFSAKAIEANPGAKEIIPIIPRSDLPPPDEEVKATAPENPKASPDAIITEDEEEEGEDESE